MPILEFAKVPSAPRWDGNQVFFEMEDGSHLISCSISKMALEDIGGRRLFRSEDALSCFAAERVRIEHLARGKSRARPDGTPGRLHLWSEDLDDQPTDTPSAAACDGAATR